jgi:hypothetical protein
MDVDTLSADFPMQLLYGASKASRYHFVEVDEPTDPDPLHL